MPSVLADWGVDDKLELARLHDREIRRLRALEDAGGVDADLTVRIHNVASVAHQPADFGKFTLLNRWRQLHGAPPALTS